jgi:TonB family protein
METDMKTILIAVGAGLLVFACGSQSKTTPVAGNEVPPKAESLVQPAYPEEPRKAGVAGTSIVEVTIGADGAVLACSLTASSGNTSLDQAALGAARSSKFAPGTKDGRPVEMKVKVPFQFKLGDGAKESRGQTTGGTYWVRWPDEPQCRVLRETAAAREV